MRQAWWWIPYFGTTVTTTVEESALQAGVSPRSVRNAALKGVQYHDILKGLLFHGGMNGSLSLA